MPLSATAFHATLTGASADPTALVDGVKWDAGHTVTISGTLTAGDYGLAAVALSGNASDLTGTGNININGTVGATTPAAGSFTVIKPTSSPTTAWGLDFTGAPQVTVPGSGSVALPTGSGLVMLVDTTTTGQTGLYLIGGSATASAALIGGGTAYVAPTVTPAASKYSMGYDGTNWKIYNGNASPITFNVCLIRGRTLS